MKEVGRVRERVEWREEGGAERGGWRGRDGAGLR